MKSWYKICEANKVAMLKIPSTKFQKVLKVTLAKFWPLIRTCEIEFIHPFPLDGFSLSLPSHQLGSSPSNLCIISPYFFCLTFFFIF